MIPQDQPRIVEITGRERVYTGAIWAIDRDEFQLGEQRLVRDFMSHMGAVGVLAVDDAGRLLVITQYRHAVGLQMVEIPAGLLDLPGEDPQSAAARELLEEAGYAADNWSALVDICTSPGSTSEGLRIFLATGLHAVGRDDAALDGEETEIQIHWVPLADAVDQILAGHWQNPTVVAGVLAYAARGDRELRAANAEWPLRAHELATGRIFTRS